MGLKHNGQAKKWGFSLQDKELAQEVNEKQIFLKNKLLHK